MYLYASRCYGLRLLVFSKEKETTYLFTYLLTYLLTYSSESRTYVVTRRSRNGRVSKGVRHVFKPKSHLHCPDVLRIIARKRLWRRYRVQY